MAKKLKYYYYYCCCCTASQKLTSRYVHGLGMQAATHVYPRTEWVTSRMQNEFYF